jgi:hypothetical protein
MTDRSKFEQMLEYLISEEQDKAKELFHQLVVEKSREIYEEILSEDFNEAKDEDDEEVDEARDDDEEVEEGMEVTFSETDDEEDMGGMDDMDAMSGDEIGGDATDDFMGDIEAGDEEGDDMGGDGDIEDRVVDLEDALDDLKAEFEKMMGDEGSADDAGDDMGGDDMGDEEPADDEEEDELKDSFNISDNFMREYIEKVTGGHGAEKKSSGDNGDNVRSPIAGKNDMGGTTANIAKGGEAGGKGVQSGLLKPNTKEENFGNINVPGGNAGKTAFKKKEPGHGAEKKGSGDNGDKGAGSPINGVRSRAK